jgi:hypothetical protein
MNKKLTKKQLTIATEHMRNTVRAYLDDNNFEIVYLDDRADVNSYTLFLKMKRTEMSKVKEIL